MKIHKQVVFIESYSGQLEIVSFYDRMADAYGADIFYEGKLMASHLQMKNEPLRDHLLSLGYHYINIIERKPNNLTII